MLFPRGRQPSRIQVLKRLGRLNGNLGVGPDPACFQISREVCLIDKDFSINAVVGQTMAGNQLVHLAGGQSDRFSTLLDSQHANKCEDESETYMK